MGRVIFSFFWLGVFVLIAGCAPIFGDMIIEVKPCQGPEVDNWFDKTYERIEIVNSDESLTTSNLKRMYEQQQNQLTHICMSKAQEYATSIFYHQWKALQALEQGNIDESFDHLVKSNEAYDLMAQEIYFLADEYDWPGFPTTIPTTAALACTEENVSDYLDELADIMLEDEIDNDTSNWPDDFSAEFVVGLAAQSGERYIKHKGLNYPDCISDLANAAEEYLRIRFEEFKALVAADFDETLKWTGEAEVAFIRMETELEALKTKYIP